MEEIVRYNYRLRQGKVAGQYLMSEWHRNRFLWNEAVHQFRSGRNPTLTKLGKLLTEARSQFVWLREGSQDAQAQTLRNYAQALDQSFKIKGRGRPKFKEHRKTLPSLAYSCNGFSIQDDRLHLAKCPSIPVVWDRPLPCKPTSVRVFRNSLGHWYASFVVRRDAEEAPKTDGGIGVDWGVITTATTTDPAYDLHYLGHRKKCAAELAKAQRKMSRRYKKGKTQSNGYKQARLSAAKLHKKAARQTQHDSRIWAKRVVDNHQMIAVEDFRPKFLAKSTMAKKSSDAAIGAAKRELVQRGQRAGRKVVMVQPAYTSMTCGQCFARTKRLDLKERTFLCESCGFTADRDRNAANIMLAVAERVHIGADDVRHSQPIFGSVGVLSEPARSTALA